RPRRHQCRSARRREVPHRAVDGSRRGRTRPRHSRREIAGRFPRTRASRRRRASRTAAAGLSPGRRSARSRRTRFESGDRAVTGKWLPHRRRAHPHSFPTPQDLDAARTHTAYTPLMIRTRLLSIALMLSAALPISAQRGGRDDPSPVIRSLVVAMYSNDVAAYNKLTMPHPLRSRLTSGGRVNENGLRDLKEDPGGLQIKQKRPFEFQGKEAKPGANGQYPIGTTAHDAVAHRGGPMVMGLVRQADGWKVDLRWWIAMTDLMAGNEPAKDSPEFAIKSLLMSMLQGDRRTAVRYITDAKGM